MLEQCYVVDEAKEERYRQRADLRDRMANFSACLRDAGALCRAWELGNEACPQDYEDWVHASETHIARHGSWFPGCGREAER